jgi:hypothetical protein
MWSENEHERLHHSVLRVETDLGLDRPHHYLRSDCSAHQWHPNIALSRVVHIARQQPIEGGEG